MSSLIFRFTVLVPILQVSESFFNQRRNLLENKPQNSVLMTIYEAKEPVGSLGSRGEIIYHRNICDAQWLKDNQKNVKLFQTCLKALCHHKPCYQLLIDENLSNFISFTGTVLVMMVMSS